MRVRSPVFVVLVTLSVGARASHAEPPAATGAFPAAGATATIGPIRGPLAIDARSLGDDCRGAFTSSVVVRASGPVDAVTLHTTGSTLYVRRPDGMYICDYTDSAGLGLDLDLVGPPGDWVVYSGSRNYASPSKDVATWTLSLRPTGTRYLPPTLAEVPLFDAKNPRRSGPYTAPMEVKSRELGVDSASCDATLTAPILVHADAPFSGIDFATDGSALYVERPDGSHWCVDQRDDFTRSTHVKVDGPPGDYLVRLGQRYGDRDKPVTASLWVHDPKRPRDVPFDASALPQVAASSTAAAAVLVHPTGVEGEQPALVVTLDRTLTTNDLWVQPFPRVDHLLIVGPLTANYDEAKRYGLHQSPAATLVAGRYAVFADPEASSALVYVADREEAVPAFDRDALVGAPSADLDVARRDLALWFPGLRGADHLIFAARMRYPLLEKVPRGLWVTPTRDFTSADLRPLGLPDFADNGSYVTKSLEAITPVFPTAGEPVVFARGEGAGGVVLTADGGLFVGRYEELLRGLAPLGPEPTWPAAVRNTRTTLELLAREAESADLGPFRAFDASVSARNACISAVGGQFGAATEGVIISAAERQAASDRASAGYAGCPSIVGDEAQIRAALQAKRDAYMAAGYAAVKASLEQR